MSKLLEPDFPGRNELLDQLDSVSARGIDDHGSLTTGAAPLRPLDARFQPSAQMPAVWRFTPFFMLQMFTPYGQAGVKWGDGKPETDGT